MFVQISYAVSITIMELRRQIAILQSSHGDHKERKHLRILRVIRQVFNMSTAGFVRL